ncbi:transposase [Streptomyces regalis]|uniref:Transposase n=1 Tax=Streptomyces regalis TaxID=68262 RepID=A0A0X3UV10_9ACTN|nr:transposase [Streptomyces regalis]
MENTRNSQAPDGSWGVHAENSTVAERPDPLAYQCRLPLSSTTLDMVANLVRSHLKKIGSRWRKLSPGRIALIVLAVLRHDQRLADMADAYQVSASTVRRWLLEVIHLLATRAERLDRALNKLARRGGAVVLIDGMLIPTRRRTGADNRPNYSGKRKMHGLHVLALTDEKGNLIWVSAARRGRTHDVTAARHDHITAHLRAAGLGAIADLGFLGLDDDPDNPVIITGYRAARGRRLSAAQKEANKLVARERAANEHAFGDLKNWRVLTKLRLGARHATALLRALLVLTRTEVSR